MNNSTIHENPGDEGETTPAAKHKDMQQEETKGDPSGAQNAKGHDR